jgi:hypothetical protein
MPLLIAGGVGALVLVAVLGFVLLGGRERPAAEEAEAADGEGLQIELAQTEVGNIDPNRPLRCFVGGRFVGELTVAQCAQRNGVPTGQLDVGLDDTGALAAVVSPAPPPPPIDPLAVTGDPPPPPLVEQMPPIPPPAASGPTGECLRYAGDEWRGLGEALTLETCVQVLFSGRCARPGEAQHGRWNNQSLRLVQGGVEIDRGGGYRPLASQDPQTCLFP